MGKRIVYALGVLASIATIFGLLVALNIIHPLPNPVSSTLIVSPSSIKAEDCMHAQKINTEDVTFFCRVTLSLSGHGSLNWAAAGGPSGTQFNPSEGTLESGQSVTVSIVTNAVLTSGTVQGTCPATANLIFTNQTNPTDTVTVAWSC